MSKYNLYLISQTENNGYDTYDSAVVVTENETFAASIHPNGDNIPNWWNPDEGEYVFSGLRTWVHPNKVQVKPVGYTNDNFKLGTVLCASFNAG